MLVVPLGSTEQHGPHLPLDTDTTITVTVAERAAAAVPQRSLRLRSRSVHPGSTPAAKDIVDRPGGAHGGDRRDCADDWPGVRSCGVVNGHGEDAEAVQAAAAVWAEGAGPHLAPDPSGR